MQGEGEASLLGGAERRERNVNGRAAAVKLLSLGLLLVSACAPAGPAASVSEQRPAAPGAGKTLVFVIAVELPTFATTPLQKTSATNRAAGVTDTLNATLVF